MNRADILLVDNGSNLTSALQKNLPASVVTLHWNELQGHDLTHFRAMILSGGSLFEVEGHESLLQAEFQAVQCFAGPILGICYGMEVMVKAFGGTLEKMPVDHKGSIDISVIQSDPIFGLHNTFSVFEHHQWQMKDVPSDFSVLARSVHGPEAIRHCSRPIYGLQFHPEKIVEDGMGHTLIQNFLELSGF